MVSTSKSIFGFGYAVQLIVESALKVCMLFSRVKREETKRPTARVTRLGWEGGFPFETGKT
jgi:hypothetical protein